MGWPISSLGPVEVRRFVDSPIANIASIHARRRALQQCRHAYRRQTRRSDYNLQQWWNIMAAHISVPQHMCSGHQMVPIRHTELFVKVWLVDLWDHATRFGIHGRTVCHRSHRIHAEQRMANLGRTGRQAHQKHKFKELHGPDFLLNPEAERRLLFVHSIAAMHSTGFFDNGNDWV